MDSNPPTMSSRSDRSKQAPKEECPLCKISEDTIRRLKEKGKSDKDKKKIEKEKQ